MAVITQPVRCAIILLITALLLGGEGNGQSVANLGILAVTLALLAWHLALSPPDRVIVASFPLLFLATCAGLIVLQLLPLPAGLWRALPGRELAAAIADQIGWGEHAHALSLDPPATLRAFFGLLPPAAMLLFVTAMDTDERRMLARVAIGGALISLILGLVQLLSAGAIGTLYPDGHIGYASGLFANRNHQASVLLIALALSSAAWPQRREGEILAIPLALSLIAGVVATTSRAGLLLLPGALLPLLLRHVRMRWTMAVLALPIIGIAGYVLVQYNATIRFVVARLHGGNMGRLTFWQDSVAVLLRYWPVGSGFGTFPAVFQGVEPLDHVGSHYVNHAHNDLIEAVVEGGLPALLLLLAMVIWWACRSLAIRHLNVQARGLEVAASAGLLVIFLHSLVDYPARLLPVGVMAAMLAGFLTLPLPSSTAQPRSRPRPSFRTKKILPVRKENLQ